MVIAQGPGKWAGRRVGVAGDHLTVAGLAEKLSAATGIKVGSGPWFGEHGVGWGWVAQGGGAGRGGWMGGGGEGRIDVAALPIAGPPAATRACRKQLCECSRCV